MTQSDRGFRLDDLFSDGFPDPEPKKPEAAVEDAPGDTQTVDELEAEPAITAIEEKVVLPSSGDQAEAEPEESVVSSPPLAKEPPEQVVPGGARVPSSVGNEEKAAPTSSHAILSWKQAAPGRSSILNFLLWAAVIGGGLALTSVLVEFARYPTAPGRLLGFGLSYALLLATRVIKRIPWRVRAWTLVGLGYGVAFLSFYWSGFGGSGSLYLIAIPVACFGLFGPHAGAIAAVANGLAYGALLFSAQMGWLEASWHLEVGRFAGAVSGGASFAFILGMIMTIQWLHVRAQRQMMRMLQNQTEMLSAEQQASQDRQTELSWTHAALKKRSGYLELALNIAQAAGSGANQQKVAAQATALLGSQRALQEVSLLILEEDRDWALLVAHTGQDRSPPSELPIRIETGAYPLLQKCLLSGAPVLVDALDAEEGEPLPMVDAEMALSLCSAAVLPLAAQGRLWGMLTLASPQADQFQKDEVVWLRMVADQLAIVLSNVRLVEELKDQAKQMAALQRYYVRETWEEFLPSRPSEEYRYDQPGAGQPHGIEAEIERLLADPDLTVLGEEQLSSGSAVLAPISLRNQVIGVLGLYDEHRSLTEDEIGIIETISEQIGLIVDNARLFEEARETAVRERTVREAGAQMRESLNVDMVMRVAAQQMREALGLHDVSVELDLAVDGRERKD